MGRYTTFAFSVLFSVVVFVSCILIGMALGRRDRRRRRRDHYASFKTEPPTDPSAKVDVLLQDGTRREAWFRTPIGWIDAVTLTSLDDVVGWRWPAFSPEDDEERLREGKAKFEAMAKRGRR